VPNIGAADWLHINNPQDREVRFSAAAVPR